MWQRMSVDEYAEFEKANHAEVTKTDGLWWRRKRFFFYQPLFPFQQFIPGTRQAPAASAAGGFQHLVPDEAAANSRQHFFIWDDLPGYSLARLNHNRRNNVKRGMKAFSVREIRDSGELVSEGYPVYREFYERTQYGYKKERTDRKFFREWALMLYRFPKVKIMGAYERDSRLSAVDITYRVEDVLIGATFFSRTDSLRKRVGDVMIHTVREMAAASSGIRFVYEGTVTGNEGLDQSKLNRGCRILSKPAFYQLNPLAVPFLKYFMKESYKKLTGGTVLERAGPVDRPGGDPPSAPAVNVRRS